MSSNKLTVILVVALIIVTLLVVRLLRSRRELDEMARRGEVPGEPVNMSAVIDQVIQGMRPHVIKDGRYWVINGLEVVGQQSLTRLIDEGPASADEVREILIALADTHSVRPSRIEDHKLTRMSPDELGGLFRVTGRHRPWGAWLAVFPPEVIGSRGETQR